HLHVRRLDERSRCLPRERSRERPGPARRLEILGGVAAQRTLADQVPVEAPQRGDTPGDARGPEAAGAEALEVLDDVVGGDPAERAGVSARGAGERGDVAG